MTLVLLVIIIASSWWPSVTIQWHRSESTWVQIVAYCLMAPSHCLDQWVWVQIVACCLMSPRHYLDQWAFIISGILCHSHWPDSVPLTLDQFHSKCTMCQLIKWLLKYCCKITFTALRSQWVNIPSITWYYNSRTVAKVKHSSDINLKNNKKKTVWIS